MTPEAPREPSPGYQLSMLVLCVYSLLILTIQTVVKLDPETGQVLDYADNAVCVFFMIDFVVSLARAPDRKHYFLTWGWLDLLSSVPSLDIVRWGRAARIVRVLRVLRGLRATKIVAELLLRRRAENAVLAASLVTLLLVIFCSIAVLHFEDEPTSNIKTGEDAVWWSFSTITTVGASERYPVTSEGRFIAAILMSAGIGLFGTFSGFLAAWFMGPQAREGQHDVQAELAAMRAEMAGLRQELARGREPGP